MSALIKMLMTLLVFVVKSESTMAVHKFVYQKDMSEYCRRRVVPSVFLGRHVVDAYSQILHFSKMELPYSCSISIRTESGSNIILVVQLLSDDSLINSCAENSNQFLVYEMGETYSGYWGPLPETIMNPKPAGIKLYTLKTTQATVTEPSTEEDTTSEKTYDMPSKVPSDNTNDELQYITVEIPLVNVSGQLVPGDPPVQKVSNEDEDFDLILDVTPRSGVRYETSILPLVQFAIKKQKSGRRGDVQDSVPPYQLEYGVFTPDYRLTYPYWSGKSTKRRYATKFKYNSNRRLKFDRNKTLFTKIKNNTKKKYFVHYSTEQLDITINDRILGNQNVENDMEAWKNIVDILSSHKKHEETTKENHDSEFKKFMSEISSSNKNLQVIKTNLISSTVPLPVLKMQIENITTSDTLKITQLSSKNLPTNVTEASYTNVTEDSVTATVYKIFNTSLLTGSMVDHQSWENVVQAAPVMAVRLNQTVLNETIKDVGIKSIEAVVSTTDIKLRKKRYIEAIAIEQARPHKRATQAHTLSTASTQFQLSDAQEFAQLVELQDDEIHDRVALRYMRHYVGRMLFNICDYQELKARHVYLFNSSRIVLAIRNFTLERMTVVMTPAYSMLNGELRCSEALLECQVSGTRVCIDSMTACDGVPNCGAYDIYDEDRLMCGAAVGLQHTVLLAAVTFLAVMLTMLYTVHYWLKRCVPKVSDAFFIYTEGDDNELHLDSIMRSPNDNDDVNKMIYGHLFEDDMIYQDAINEKRTLFSCKWLEKCLFSDCFRKRTKKEYDDVSSNQNVHLGRKAYSFTELELYKMSRGETVDVSIQTGDSLEIAHLKTLGRKENKNLKHNKELITASNKENYQIEKSSVISDTVELNQKHLEELNMLKLFKEARSESVSLNKSNIKSSPESVLLQIPAITEEREIVSHLYDAHKDTVPSQISTHDITATADVHEDKLKFRKQQIKRLRFDEETITIPSEDYEQEADDNFINQHTVISSSRKIGQELDVIVETSEQASTSRDFKRFWGNKGKKSKKKSHMSLR
ncbi:uncharacterized protein LOC113522983 [Galleria mellonella]|uniref:Uncharacterized protein LOC113522983 n=1 Tax=Galleria mellonella TaxID=7137 RepID=A0ABM3MQS8_GALME|nr:uncharacterized protein LOC113522983 [Galleria mellonella]